MNRPGSETGEQEPGRAAHSPGMPLFRVSILLSCVASLVATAAFAMIGAVSAECLFLALASLILTLFLAALAWREGRVVSWCVAGLAMGLCCWTGVSYLGLFGAGYWLVPVGYGGLAVAAAARAATSRRATA